MGKIGRLEPCRARRADVPVAEGTKVTAEYVRCDAHTSKQEQEQNGWTNLQN